VSNPRLRDWSGRRVWILGASSGIGEALARELAGQGARLALSARRADALAALSATLPGSLVLLCDAAQPATMRQAHGELVRQWDGIDLAVYAAGVWHPRAVADLDGDAIDATLDINLRGAMHFAATVLPGLRERGAGAIAFIGSVSAYGALPQACLYGASKAGLAYFAATLHLELAPKGVGVFLVSPGFVDTPMTAANDFPMPAMMAPDAAAGEILAGLAGGDFEIHFPKRLSRPLRWARLLPDSLYFPLTRALTGGRT
jgi:NAD(P)-dependent dehydrogenase (short-subunit alcohol dehydrogenase family)